ncbi:hypothetical protein [Stigmatella aurantiaca]|uniref:Conserved uncharacterized protein n=1 Tax=Stigmatella aurantiaca (strain DW4/3-1) TaxID=378806 RepID=Q08R47_STIAD|nr:hypothetical protein [Stigmatella aurantiaca]ADO70948.1 conserved uncharacterized protein [Stigmatella aurantiaca DW4/3-1]EAU62963.1 hypothetical protein STIAU_4486 [Stigmatella aurantiaca DW4/3-1]
MFVHRIWAVVVLLLLPGEGWTEDLTEPQARSEVLSSPVALRPRSRWAYLLRLEATALALIPKQGTEEGEGFVQLEPMVVLDGGETFGLNLGAPVRLRLWGGGKGDPLVRKEDWDTLSDWGQLIRLLNLGSDASPVSLWAGSLDSYSLLSGHLVRRYSNRGNPDDHPAGAVLTGSVGPLYTEAFVSDVLGARLAGAEVEVDVQHVLSGRPEEPGRYTLALSAVHDWARAGGAARPVTLAHVDGTAVVGVRRGQDSGFEAEVFAGWGGRPGDGGAWGAVAGVGADAVSPTLDLQARLEVRRQQGGFRQGYFGPDYELARFRVAGNSGVPLAEDAFPKGYSAFGEVIVAWDAVYLGDLVQRHLRCSVSAEAFTWGRVDADMRLTAQLFRRNVEVAFRGLAVGMRQPGARYLTSGEVRWRFLGGKLFALGQGGTLLYPEAEGGLRPGAFASVGMGVDNVR